MSEPQEHEAEVTVYYGPFCDSSKEVPVTVYYYYIPGDHGCFYQRNGDPGWPPEEPEIEIIGVTGPDGKELFCDEQTLLNFADDIMAALEKEAMYAH
jgi:hypothetical protein